jgi:hypothetical protein
MTQTIPVLAKPLFNEEEALAITKTLTPCSKAIPGDLIALHLQFASTYGAQEVKLRPIQHFVVKADHELSGPLSFRQYPHLTQDVMPLNSDVQPAAAHLAMLVQSSINLESSISEAVASFSDDNTIPDIPMIEGFLFSSGLLISKEHLPPEIAPLDLCDPEDVAFPEGADHGFITDPGASNHHRLRLHQECEALLRIVSQRYRS